MEFVLKKLAVPIIPVFFEKKGFFNSATESEAKTNGNSFHFSTNIGSLSKI